MKRRKLLKNKTTAYIAASILTLALAGVTCGTFAWFNYDTRTPVSELNGTTVGVNGLDIGILSNVSIPNSEDYGLIKDETVSDQLIYWFEGNVLGSETLNHILSLNGYATDTLYPVSSRKYSEGDDLNLYSAPTVFHDIDSFAEKECYISTTLVFRCKDLLEDENIYLSNENIYLSKFKLKTTSEDNEIHRAIRIFTNNHVGLKHLINPTVNNDDSTAVAGVLDLNKDGYYDCDDFNNVQYEHVYGQAKESIYRLIPEESDSLIPLEERNTFVANHKSGTFALENIVPEVAQYEGFYGFRNKRKCVTTTNPDTNNYAYLDLSIFIEGWDLNVIDSQIGMQFSIELTFDTAL